MISQPHVIAAKLSDNSVDMQLGFLSRREGVSDSALSSDEHHLSQPQRTENRSSTRVEFPGGATPFPLSGSCVDYAAVGKPQPGFSFAMERDGGNVQNRGWNVDVDVDSASGDGSDRDEDDGADGVDDDEFDDEDDEVHGLVSADVVNVNRNSNTSSGSVQSSSERVSLDRTNVEEHVSCFGLSRTITTKCGNEMRDNSAEPHRRCEGRDNYGNAIIVVEPVPYCSQIFHGGDGASTPQKAAGGDNVYNFCRKRQGSFSVYPGESVRAHLSDPVTGILMDDAIILPCGHSFGVGGMQHVKQMKACFNCSLPISEDSVRPNLALRAAVQAFLREEESHSSRISKRRRYRFEPDRYANDDQLPMDSRNRGVQFPFNVSDRVIIKGNKRTPDRFVGRIAVVTTQCLNGWYVVKTLDNAESVKLQYRSLEKALDDSSNFIGSKAISSNWL